MLLLASAFFVHALASSWDSVAVFHRPEKVIVLVHEDGVADLQNNRLRRFMSLFGQESSLVIEFKEGDLRIQCAKDDFRARCSFRILPGVRAGIEPKKVVGHWRLKELFEGNDSTFQADFLNSNGDAFAITVSENNLWLIGSKK